jgi:polyisoprenoid-binding protein YceI
VCLAALALPAAMAQEEGGGEETSEEAADAVYRVDAERSEAGFHASSTLHDFSGSAGRLGGSLRFDPEAPGSVRGEVWTPVAQLDTGNDSRDRDMRAALGAERHPRIAYSVEGFTPGETPDAAAELSGEVEGTITIHGEARPWSLPVRLTRLADGAWRVEGSAALDMREHGVDPPTAFFGALRVRPEVEVFVDLVLEPESNAAATGADPPGRRRPPR